MIKFVLFMCAVAFIHVGVSGQEPVPEVESEHAIHYISKQRSSGFFIGIDADYAEIEREEAVFFGAKIGYVHNHSLDIGVAGKAFFAELDRRRISGQAITLTGTYGGLYASPRIFSNRKVQIGLPVLLGAGAVGYINDSVEDILDHGDDEIEDWDMILIAEPGLDVILNLSRHFQIEIGGSYRITNDIDLQGIGDVDIHGLSAGISLKFGLL